MRCGCVLLIVAIALVVLGIQEIHDAHAFTKPVDITCEQFIKSSPREGWYRITGGVMEVADAAFSVTTKHSDVVTTAEGDPKITEVYLPVHSPASWDEKAATYPPTNLVVQTMDPDIIATVKQLKRLDAGRPEEAKKWYLKNLDKLMLKRDVMGMVQTGINSSEKTHDEIGKLQGSLTPDYLIVEEGKQPSMSGGLGMFFGGLLAGVVSVIYWGNLLLRWKRRVR
jgi:hypothetical protein